MKPFSLASLMFAVAVVALLLTISRLGYWYCIASWVILGSLVLTTIPLLSNGAPRFLFVLLGAVGGMCGCWLALRVYAASTEQPTTFITTIEYESLYWRHLMLLGVLMLFSSFVGSAIGLAVCRFSEREQSEAEDGRRHSQV